MAAISLGAALVGSAIIGAGASAIGAGANNKAINRANDAQQQAAQNSLALQRDTYNRNNAILSPYSQRGNAAGESINALLGIEGASSVPSSGGGLYGDVDWNAYIREQPDVLWDYNTYHQGEDPETYAMGHFARDGSKRDLGAFSAAPPQTAVSASGAFDNYLNSAGYQFQLGEANKAANAQFAASVALDSGAAVKAAQGRAQNIGTGFFNNYLGLLANQQGVGLGAASAVAGVGQNYANNVTNLNSNMANSTANTAMAKAGNTNALLGNLSSSFGLGLGALSSFGGGAGGYRPGTGSGTIGNFW